MNDLPRQSSPKDGIETNCMAQSDVLEGEVYAINLHPQLVSLPMPSLKSVLVRSGPRSSS